MTNIDDLLSKIDGNELSAAEFVRLVKAVTENQIGVALLPDKIGYVIKTTTDGQRLHFFKDKTTAEAWLENPEGEDQPITSVILPDGGGSQASYVVRLETNSTQTVESSNKNVSVNLRMISKIYNPVDQSTTDTGEDGTLTIQHKVGTENWTTVATINNFSSVQTGGEYTSIDLSPYLVNGSQNIRFIVKGNTSLTSSTYVIFNITVAEMTIEFNNNWEEAYVYDTSIPTSTSMNIGFKISGSVNKELNYEVYDYDNNLINYGKINIGTGQYTESKYLLTIPNPLGVNEEEGSAIKKVAISSIIKVKAWLDCANTSIVTDSVEQNMMIIKSTDKIIMACVNNVQSIMTNWSVNHVFDYAVYNSTLETGLTDIQLLLTNYDGTTTWLTTTVDDVATGTLYDYSPYLSIENYDSQGEKIKQFSSKVSIMTGTTELKTLSFTVDNSSDYSPTTGANFVLLPSTRSNNDSDKETIHNDSSLTTEPKLITPTWTNVAFEQDGWVINDSVRSLRILAGGSVNIPYESYSNTTVKNGLTIELDFKTNNISDESVPVFQMGKEDENGQFVGFIMYPKKGYMYKASGNNQYFQDVDWQENVRTFIAVNIMPKLEISGSYLNVCRIFINDKINREFTFTTNDRFWDGSSSNGITIGSTSADIDVYSLRIFREKQLSSTDILHDYVSGLSDTIAKATLISANNITEGNTISYDKAKLIYNTLVWKGDYPYKGHDVTANGELTINIIGDTAHSGVITNMTAKGQGSSSKLYAKWNATFTLTDTSVWTDGNGTAQGKFYKLTNNSPKMTKTVGKVNWASSMQSHKMGLTEMYQQLYNHIFNSDSEPLNPWKYGIESLSGYENTRIAVEEEKFLFFVQADDSSDPVFYANMTWGSAKGDKNTFGYDSSNEFLKDYLMIEGSDQTPKLTLCQIPWLTDEVTYNEKEEYYQYNGIGSWDVSLGNRDSIGKFIKAHNFVYQNSTRVQAYSGNLVTLQKDTNADKSYQYVIFYPDDTSIHHYVYRFDWINNQWVDAGTSKTSGAYDRVKMELQFPDIEFSSITEVAIEQFKNARIAAFKANAGDYFYINDMLYTIDFLKFVGASDNRAKNTYLYYDPVMDRIRAAQDDLDTIFATNNQGQKQKPYWVEEHDFDSRAIFNSYFWAGSTNAMYNLFEDTYYTELRDMMKTIMQAMADLGGTGGVQGCFDTYFFSIQRYFPAVAYNEVARLFYEKSKIDYDAGTYTNDTDPITQSLGDQLQAELEWLKLRIVYIASYCKFDDALGGRIEFRQLNTSVYKVKPFMKMYLYRILGTSYTYPVGYTQPKRCEAQEEVSFNVVGGDSIQSVTMAAEYMSDLGDLSSAQVTGSTAFAAGKRLSRLKVGDDEDTVYFNPSAINSFPANATEIDLTNCGTQLTTIGSLTDCSKLKIFKALGTGIQTIILPQTNNLTEVYLPNTVQNLTLRNQNYITTFEFDKSSLKSLVMGSVNIDAKTFVEEWLDAITTSDLSTYSVTLDKLNWTNFSGARLAKLAQFGVKNISGKITLDNDSFTAEQKSIVVQAFGNIDSETNALYVVYGNKFDVSVDPLYILGGVTESNFTISSLNPSKSITIDINYIDETLSDVIKIKDKTDVTINNVRTITGKFYSDGIESNVAANIVISDGDITVTKSFIDRAQVMVSEVKLLGDDPLSCAEAGTYDISVQVKPASYTEVLDLRWGFISNSDSHVVDTDANNVMLINVNTGNIDAMMPLKSSTTSNTLTTSAIVSAKHNDPLFEITCSQYRDGVAAVTGTKGVYLHSPFKIWAIQTFATDEKNYNPAFALKLYSDSNFTSLFETINNDDGSKGIAMSMENAATKTSINSIQYIFTTIDDTEGLVVESYKDGVFEQTTYTLKTYKEIENFTNVTSIKNFEIDGSSESFNYLSGEIYFPKYLKTLSYNSWREFNFHGGLALIHFISTLTSAGISFGNNNATHSFRFKQETPPQISIYSLGGPSSYTNIYIGNGENEEYDKNLADVYKVASGFSSWKSIIKPYWEYFHAITPTITSEAAHIIIKSDNSEHIYFTTDGSDPKTSETRQEFNSAKLVVLTEDTRVRAYATLTGKEDSNEADVLVTKADYTELSYITSTGIQYLTFNSSFVTNNNYIELNISELYVQQQCTFLQSENIKIGRAIQSDSYWNTRFMLNNVYTGTINIFNSIDTIKVERDADVVKFSTIGTGRESSGSIESTGFDSDTLISSPLYLFKGVSFSAKSIILKDNENEILNAVAAIMPDGRIGMYDLVSNTFIPNSGAGKFNYTL